MIAMEKPPVKNARECIPPSKVIISSGPNFAHSKKVRIFGKIEGENFLDQKNFFPEVKGVALGLLWVCSFRKMGWPRQEKFFFIFENFEI